MALAAAGAGTGRLLLALRGRWLDSVLLAIVRGPAGLAEHRLVVLAAQKADTVAAPASGKTFPGHRRTSAHPTEATRGGYTCRSRRHFTFQFRDLFFVG